LLVTHKKVSHCQSLVLHDRRPWHPLRSLPHKLSLAAHPLH